MKNAWLWHGIWSASCKEGCIFHFIKTYIWFLQLKRFQLRLNQNSTPLREQVDAWMGNLWAISPHQFHQDLKTSNLLLPMTAGSLLSDLFQKILHASLRESLCLGQMQVALLRKHSRCYFSSTKKLPTTLSQCGKDVNNRTANWLFLWFCRELEKRPNKSSPKRKNGQNSRHSQGKSTHWRVDCIFQQSTWYPSYLVCPFWIRKKQYNLYVDRRCCIIKRWNSRFSSGKRSGVLSFKVDLQWCLFLCILVPGRNISPPPIFVVCSSH